MKRTLLIAAVTLVSTSSFAYLPPASFVLKQALEQHRAAHAYLIEGKITDLRDQSTAKETLRIDFSSGKFDAIFADEHGPLGTYVSHVKDLHRLGKAWITLGLDPNATRFEEALHELNVVPAENTDASLERFGKWIGWGWSGAGTNGAGGDAKLFFLKDEFLPLDYQTGQASATDAATDAAQASTQEVRVEEYTAPSGSIRIPKSVLIKIAGKDTFRYELKSVKLNPVIKTAIPAQELKTPLTREWVTLVR